MGCRWRISRNLVPSSGGQSGPESGLMLSIVLCAARIPTRSGTGTGQGWRIRVPPSASGGRLLRPAKPARLLSPCCPAARLARPDRSQRPDNHRRKRIRARDTKSHARQKAPGVLNVIREARPAKARFCWLFYTAAALGVCARVVKRAQNGTEGARHAQFAAMVQHSEMLNRPGDTLGGARPSQTIAQGERH